ncbi:MAG: histidine kinase, partial [Chloroflexi bacterium]|nr:histidine kinase [Chloroflexota bacterium]
MVTLQDLTPLENLERLRADFLGLVSHELREPLTSIKGSAVNLRESLGSLEPAETLQFIRIIESQSDRMRDLIGELLDVARIETGQLSVTPEPADVGALVDEARNTFLAGGGGRNVTLDLEPDLPWVMADRRRIVQVLGNLLSNAARYSEEGSPIRLRGALEGGHVALTVADEGRGVEPERLPLLF